MIFRGELWLNFNFSAGIGIGEFQFMELKLNWNTWNWNENHVNGIEIEIFSRGKAALWMVQSVSPGGVLTIWRLLYMLLCFDPQFLRLCPVFTSLRKLQMSEFRPLFLAATKQLYKWYFSSVWPSVTPFWLCFHHRIIMKFSGVITNDQSKVHAKVKVKGQGHRGNNPT